MMITINTNIIHEETIFINYSIYTCWRIRTGKGNEKGGVQGPHHPAALCCQPLYAARGLV